MYTTLIQYIKKISIIFYIDIIKMSSDNAGLKDMANNSLQNVIFALAGVIVLVFVVYSVSSCGCSDKNDKDMNNENYVSEYNGNSPNSKTSSNSYRLYMNSAEQDYTYPRNRCQLCKGYNNYSYEGFQNITEFKTCPHNCRQYGVSLCDQGTIM